MDLALSLQCLSIVEDGCRTSRISRFIGLVEGFGRREHPPAHHAANALPLHILRLEVAFGRFAPEVLVGEHHFVRIVRVRIEQVAIIRVQAVLAAGNHLTGVFLHVGIVPAEEIYFGQQSFGRSLGGTSRLFHTPLLTGRQMLGCIGKVFDDLLIDGIFGCPGLVVFAGLQHLRHQRHPAESTYEIEVEESPKKTGLSNALHPEFFVLHRAQIVQSHIARSDSFIIAFPPAVNLGGRGIVSKIVEQVQPCHTAVGQLTACIGVVAGQLGDGKP